MGCFGEKANDGLGHPRTIRLGSQATFHPHEGRRNTAFVPVLGKSAALHSREAPDQWIMTSSICFNLLDTPGGCDGSMRPEKNVS